MEFNFYPILASGIITLIAGFVWYHPKVFGTIWMREAKLTEEELSKGNMLKIFGLTYIYSLFIGMMMMPIVIHQFGAMGMIGGASPDVAQTESYIKFMSEYGNAYRTFKHGAFHGCMTGLFFVLPLIAVNGLFERKSWKYILINGGYWVLTLTIIGSLICGLV